MNPADLIRNDSLPQLDATPPLSSKTLPGSATATKSVKTAFVAPRVDTEPIYTQLRAALGDHFAEYKAALSAFFLGMYPASLLLGYSPRYVPLDSGSSNTE